MNSKGTMISVYDISQRQAALIAGIGFLITILSVFYASTFVFSKVIVAGDAIATTRNIINNENLFRTGILSWLLLLTGDVLRAWALYVFFKRVNNSLSLLAGWFMLIHVSIFGITQLNLVFAVEILRNTEYLATIDPGQLQAISLFFINGHNYGFQIGLFFFSFHLLVLGILVFKSGYIPKLLGVFLMISCFSYMLDSTGRIISPDYPDSMFRVLFLPMLIGELALIVWLIVKSYPISGSAPQLS